MLLLRGSLRVLVLASTTPWVLHCSSASGKPGATPFVPGKADGAFDVFERPTPAFGRETAVRLDGSVPAFRVESYGGTTLRIALRGRSDGADPYLVVEGPLPGDGDATAPGHGAVLTQDDDSGGGLDAALEVELNAPGVYRVLAGTLEALALGTAPAPVNLGLEITCTASCARPEIDAKTFLTALRASGELDAFRAAADGKLASMLPEPTLRAALTAQLDTILDDPDFAGIERFPSIPLRQVGTLRPALGGLDAEPPAPDVVVDGELAMLLGACDAVRARPTPVREGASEIRDGHFPNLSLTACEVARSTTLAKVLTSLAANNGSVVRYRGEALTSPAALFDALMRHGHSITMRNERTYANFISLTAGEVNVRWPAWVDTGLSVSDHALVIPMGHSHHAWYVHGPDVEARVVFYLGTSGVGFFPKVDTRPAWTGEIAGYEVASTAGDVAPEIVDAARVATAYFQRIHTERMTIAAGLPSDGYGFVGVCNDSNALIELATHGTTTTFPLMRAKSLDASPELGDGLDAFLRALPHDGDDVPALEEGVRRVLAMTPHDLDSPSLFDEALRADLVAARALVGN